MSWLIAVLAGHLLNAVAYVIDKFLLTKSIKDPFAYVFFIGALGLLSLLLIPFGFEVPRATLLIVNLFSGIFFTFALLFFFQALQTSEASRIVPFIGGAIPVLTIGFEIAVFRTQFLPMQIVAFALLIAGTVLITRDDPARQSRHTARERQRALRPWLKAFTAAALFAAAFGLTKIAYNTQPFVSAFIWSRIGGAVPILLLVVSARNRSAVRNAVQIFHEKAGMLFLLGQSLGAVGFLLINYAIALTSVAVVNALQGVQYALLLMMAVIASVKYPNILKESMTHKGLVIKILAVVLIGFGLSIIATIV